MFRENAPAGMELADFVKAKDSPPVWAFFLISAFCCDTGLLSFCIRFLVDGWIRLRHGRNSATAAKVELSCRVRRLSALLLESNKPEADNLQQAAELLRETFQESPRELQAPLYCLEGKRLLFHQHPPEPQAALQAYEEALSLLFISPYCAKLAQPHHLLFGAAMAAVLCRAPEKARDYYSRYKDFVARYPRGSWGADVEQDLERRIDALP